MCTPGHKGLFKYEYNIVVLVSELCKPVGTELGNSNWGSNMDKYGTERTLFQGGNEVFQMPSNEMILSAASRAARFWVTVS